MTNSSTYLQYQIYLKEAQTSQESIKIQRLILVESQNVELACLASWKKLLLIANKTETPSGWLLLMEDDVGASLATPQSWVYSLQDIVEYCPKQTLAIQLAPISALVRKDLDRKWGDSNGKCLAVSKERVRSHGNGAILLHKQAIERLIDPLIQISHRYKKLASSIAPMADQTSGGQMDIWRTAEEHHVKLQQLPTVLLRRPQTHHCTRDMSKTSISQVEISQLKSGKETKGSASLMLKSLGPNSLD